MINLATVEKRLEILDQEIAEAERAEEQALAGETAQVGASASPTATMPGRMAHGSRKPPSWKAKTTRDQKRQRNRCRAPRRL
jgi:hypothetical protein